MADAGAVAQGVRIATPDGPMDVWLDEPAGRQDGARVVLMFPRSGMDGFPQRVARWLADNGHAVAIPDITHRCPPEVPIRDRKERLEDAQIVADIAELLAFLAERDRETARPLAIMGHCMGGRHALLGAVSFAEFAGAIVYYGGDMFEGWGRAVAPFDLLAPASPPLIGFFGAQDKNPSPSDVDRLEQRLAELGIPHTIHRYPGVGHAFQQNSDRSAQERRAADHSSDQTLGFLSALVAGGRGR